MLNITINLNDTYEEFELSNSQINTLTERVLDAVSGGILAEWRNQATKKLTKSRNEYLRGLKLISTNGERVIKLEGTLPNMIENGATPFDMKIGFSKSLKKHKSADGKGWYINVPFRFATPNVDETSAYFSNIMPVQIYNIVKSQGRISQNQIPAPFDQRKTRKPVAGFPNYTHKNSIYAGIEKQTHEYEHRSSSVYVSFRRVSSKSELGSWIHTGINARNLAQEALNAVDIPTITDITVDNTLSQMGF